MRLAPVGMEKLAGSAPAGMGMFSPFAVQHSLFIDTCHETRFPVDTPLTPEAVRAAWEVITNFADGRADNPESPQDGLKKVMQNMNNRKSGAKSSVNSRVLEAIEKAKKVTSQGTVFEYDDKDVILYNLGIGAKKMDLKWVYEGDQGFEALPTFGTSNCTSKRLR